MLESYLAHDKEVDLLLALLIAMFVYNIIIAFTKELALRFHCVTSLKPD